MKIMSKYDYITYKKLRWNFYSTAGAYCARGFRNQIRLCFSFLGHRSHVLVFVYSPFRKQLPVSCVIN